MARFRETLRHRDLRFLFAALAVSAIGSWSFSVALAAVVYERTGSLTWVAAVWLARFIPTMIISPYAGIVAERMERRGLLIRSDLLACALQVTLVVVVASNGPVTLAIGLGMLTALATSAYRPAVAALIPQIAGEDDLVSANALAASIEMLVVIIGPAVGAGVLAIGSPEAVFTLNAVSFALSALMIARMHVSTTPSDVTEGGSAGPLAQIARGLQAIREAPRAVPLLALSALANFLYGTDTVLLLAAGQQRLGLGHGGFGLLLAGLGLGGLVAATWVDRVSAVPRLSALLIGGMAAYCLPTLVLALTTSAELSIAAQVIRGAGTLLVDVLAITALQRAVAPGMVARVFGIFEVLVLGSISLGATVAPLLTHAIGLQATLVVVATAPLALALVTVPALLRVDRIAIEHRATLAPRIAVLEGLGLLRGAARAVLERMAEAATEQDVPASTPVIREGDASDALYVVLDGTVQVTVRAEAAPIRTQGPGTWFGEIGLLGRIPRTATVTASSDVRLLRIDGEAFLDALTTTPASGVLLETAGSRLARTHPVPQPVLG